MARRIHTSRKIPNAKLSQQTSLFRSTRFWCAMLCMAVFPLAAGAAETTAVAAETAQTETAAVAEPAADASETSFTPTFAHVTARSGW